MTLMPDHQCRRCGCVHEDSCQIIDSDGRWAVSTYHCECAHHWTMIYTAPNNLGVLRAWIARGCDPEEGPIAVVHCTPWRPYRLEGVSPALVSAAS